MATPTLPAGASPANAPTRRSVLGGALAAPALAFPTVVFAAVNIDRSEWDRAFAAYEAAKRANDDYDQRVCLPLYQQLKQAFPGELLTFEAPVYGNRTAKFHMIPAELHEYDNYSLPAVREKAAECRERWLAYCVMRERIEMDTADRESERLGDLYVAAEDRLMALPAPDMAALAWKLERLFCPEEDSDSTPSWSRAYATPTLEDARRLAGRA